MSPRMGRPPIDNPKKERITVRLDDDSNEILKAYCAENNVDKAQAIRKGVKSLNELHLKRKFQYKDVEVYDEFLKAFNEEEFLRLSQDKQRNLKRKYIKNFDELLGSVTRVRDEALLEEYNKTYEECFKKNISVMIDIEYNVYSLQSKYVELIENMTNIIINNVN